MDKPQKATRQLSIACFCHQCLGYYADGKQDCRNVKCPLYPWMPYAKLEPKLTWMDYNPKKVGLVTWEESKSNLTDEQREKASVRLKKIRENHNKKQDE